MRWYQTLWGITLLGLGALLLFIVLVFGTITIKFWWQIKQGKGDFLQQQVYGGFSAVQRINQSAEKVDRNVLEVGDFPFLGNPNASTTIVMFGDFLCPYTKESIPIMQKLVNTYGYKIKLIFRNFPAESIHPGATRLSQIGVCANEQGKYWNAHNYLFTNQGSLSAYLSSEDISVLSAETDLDLGKLKNCLDSSSASIKVNRDYADGYRYGVGGTPTFFINGGQKIQGVVPWEVWDKFFKEL